MPRTISERLAPILSQSKLIKLTIDVAEPTCLALFCVMKTTSPVDCDVAFASIQASSTLHATTSANTAEVEESVEDWTIITDVVFSLFFGKSIHIVRSNLLQEVDVLVGMELGHFVTGSRFCALCTVSQSCKETNCEETSESRMSILEERREN